MARELGFAHPDFLLKQLTAGQYAEWAAYYEEEPFGPEVESLRSAVVACTVANSMRSPKTPPYEVRQFQIGAKRPSLKEQVAAVANALIARAKNGNRQT